MLLFLSFLLSPFLFSSKNGRQYPFAPCKVRNLLRTSVLLCMSIIWQEDALLYSSELAHFQEFPEWSKTEKPEI